MKKICLLSLLLACLALPSFAKKDDKPVLDGEKVYMMYIKSCPMCEQALEYAEKNYLTYPNLVRVDLDTEEGKELLRQCRQKFEVKDIIVPMVCAPKEYFMGWSKFAQEKFDAMVKDTTK